MKKILIIEDDESIHNVIEEFVQWALYGISITYELISVYNISHEMTIKEKNLIKKLKSNKQTK